MTRVDVSMAGPSLTADFERAAGADAMAELRLLVRALRGRRLVMVNSTATGGGVAEILHRMVRLLNELGLETLWEVMPGTSDFHRVTKSIHNALHGSPAEVSPADWGIFEETARRAAGELELDGDLVMIHDPQPLGLAALRRARGQHWVWRCHIDLSAADPSVWNALAPHVARHDRAVFSHHAFVPPLPVPAYLVPPSIDPLSDKNRELSSEEERRLLSALALPARRPWITQVSRFDRLKDPLGVVEAFRLARRSEPAHLVLAGGSADDDPEGEQVLAEVRAAVAGRDDVSILALPPDAHATINALQRRSTLVVQKSLREGFALTVSEALWKRRAVIAGAVGGIPLQVVHDRTGVLVRSIEGCAYQITRLLRAPEVRRRFGENGAARVHRRFLLPRETRDYLAVFASALRDAAGHPG